MRSSHHQEQNFGTTLGSANGVQLQPPPPFSPTPLVPSFEYMRRHGTPSPSGHRGNIPMVMLQTDPRPRTRKIARIIDQEDRRPSSSSDPANRFSPEGSQTMEEQFEESLAVLESSDVRSMSYYRNLPVKLEDLMSDDSSVEEEDPLKVGECTHEGIKKAEGFRRKWLLRKGMRGMVWNILEQREAMKTALLHHDQQTKQSFLQKWKKKLAMAERRGKLLEIFSWWRRRTAIHTKLCDITTKKNRLVSAQCLQAWRTRLIEASQVKTALQHHHMKLRCKTIGAWKAELEKARTMRRVSLQRAEMFHRAKVMEKGFTVWRAWMLYRSEHQEKAVSLLQRAEMRGVVHRWKSYCHSKKQCRVLEEGFKEAKTRKVVRSALVIWKERWILRQKSLLAQHVHLLHIKRRTLQAWRLYIYNRTLKKLCEAYLNEKTTALLQASFDKWVCQTASLVGEDLLSSRLSVAHRSVVLQKTFTGWLMTTRLSRGLGRLRERQERRIAKKFFQIWRSTWLHIKALEARGLEMEKWRTKRLFYKWRDQLLHRKLEMTTMQKQNLHNLRSAFKFWKAECSRHIALHGFVVRRDRTLLRTSLGKWKVATETKTEMAKTQFIVQFHNNEVLRRCFSNWRKCTKESEAETCSQMKALQLHIQRLRLESSLRCWRRQLQCRETTRRYLAERKHLFLLDCFSTWREFTASSNELASQQFVTRLQQALSKDPQTSPTMADTSLANVSYNLGLIADANCHLASISLPLQSPSSGHQSPDIQQQAATTTQGGREGSRYERPSSGGIHTHSTPYPTADLHHLSHRIQQSLASSSLTIPHLRPLPSSVFGSNSNSNASYPLRVKPVRRKLFREGDVGPNNAEESSTIDVSPAMAVPFSQSSDPTTHDHAESPPRMCNCLNPGTLHQIQTVQHKLDELSPSFYTSSSFELVPGSKHDDLPGAYPILAPPSGFGSDDDHPSLTSFSDAPRSPSITATLSLITRNQTMNSTTTNTQDELPLPMQQLSLTLKYMRLYPCSRVFRIWRRYTMKMRNLKEISEVAHGHMRTKKMKNAFCTWKDLSSKLSKLGDLKEQFCTKASNKLLRNSIAMWRERNQRRQADEESETKAVQCHTLACMKKHFLHWKGAYCSLMERQNNHHQQAERLVTLKSSFQQWRRLSTRKQVARRFLKRWKQTATARRRDKQAEALWQYWQLSNAWGKWRREYVRETTVTTLVERGKAEVLRQVFTSWRRHAVSMRCQ